MHRPGLIIKTFLFAGSLTALHGNVASQVAGGKCKFLGNIIAYSVPSDFNTYWNQVSPENAGKWGSVELGQDVMSWSNLDRAYNHAKDSGFPFRQHNFVWGQQQPEWINGLSQAEQREEVEEWIQLYGSRYPLTDYIDVVNEPLHAPPDYSQALGGSGKTGWDWVLWTFRKAREYCPDAELHINDYGILGSSSATTQYLEIINILQDSGLIDGIGVQAHGLESVDTSTIRTNLDRLAETGLPVYITEYDVNLASDAQQFNVYFEQFPVFWLHPDVAGITLWGYIQGQIWKQDAYLIRNDGSERPAFTWLKTYVLTTDAVCRSTGYVSPPQNAGIRFYPNPVSDGRITLDLIPGPNQVRIFDLSGRLVQEEFLRGSAKKSLNLELGRGLYLLQVQNGEHLISRKLMVQ